MVDSLRVPLSRLRAGPLRPALRIAGALLAVGGIWLLASGGPARAQSDGLGVVLSFDDYYSYGSGSLTPFDLQSGMQEPSVSLPSPTAVVLTPDARMAWVTSAASNNLSSSGSVVPVDLTTRPATKGAPVTLPGAVNDSCGPNSHRELDALAITPSGHTLYAADAQSDQIYPVDVTRSPAQPLGPIGLPSGSHPAAIAISSDGSTVYTANAGTNSVSVISVPSNTIEAQIDLAPGSAPDGLALAPGGHTLYVAEAGRGAVAPVALPARTVGTEITTGGTPNGVVIAPDGSRVYVTIGQANRCLSPSIPASGAVGLVPIATSTGHAGAPLGDGKYSFPALSTDGDTAYVTADRQDVQSIDLRTGHKGPAIGPLYNVHGIAVAGTSVRPSGVGVIGTVRDGAHRGAALPGARVELCPTGAPARCLSESSGRDGSFSFIGVQPGSFTLAAWPALGSGLFEQTDGVTISRGHTRTHDLVLRAAVPLSSGITVSSPSGTARDGVPLVFATSPFTVRLPLDPPPRGRPNSRRLYGAVFQLRSDIGINATDVAMFEVRYGPDGRPAAVSELMDGPGRVSAGSVTAASRRGSGPAAVTASGLDEIEPLCQPHDVFSIRPDDPGGVEIRINGFPGGPLSFHFDPIALPSPQPTGNTSLDIAATGLVAAANAGINEVPGVGEYNGLIYGLNIAANLAQGNYAQAASNTFFNFAVPEFGGGVDHGPVQFVAHEFAAGVAQDNVDRALTPAADEGCSLSELRADLYIDPSGRVLTAGGQPLSRARVLLTRSATRNGHQVRVPNGSALMSPANRRNPDHTDLAGLFGWDVLPGFYRVTASHRGCTASGHRKAAMSPLLRVPPPAVNLVLRLRCPKLSFAHAVLHLRVHTIHLGRGKLATVLSAEVKGRGRKKPTGTVTFLVRRRHLGALALSSSGVTRLMLPGRVRGPVSARYSGDGRYATATGRRAG